MKTLRLFRHTTLVFLLLISLACSSDDSGESDLTGEPYFEFTITEITGKTTLQGKFIKFNSNFTEVTDPIDMTDVTLNTIAFVAQLEDGSQSVTFLITMEDQVSTGNHKLGTDLFEWYNASLIYSNGDSETFYSDGGSINLSNIGSTRISGSLNVTAHSSDSEVGIDGKFLAASN